MNNEPSYRHVLVLGFEGGLFNVHGQGNKLSVIPGMPEALQMFKTQGWSIVATANIEANVSYCQRKYPQVERVLVCPNENGASCLDFKDGEVKELIEFDEEGFRKSKVLNPPWSEQLIIGGCLKPNIGMILLILELYAEGNIGLEFLQPPEPRSSIEKINDALDRMTREDRIEYPAIVVVGGKKLEEPMGHVKLSDGTKLKHPQSREFIYEDEPMAAAIGALFYTPEEFIKRELPLVDAAFGML